ncbi:phosphotriesterase family protein [Fictibacillus terranigra]|uniref:Phosphotriesterase-related protein n=1 Tax=Fictibacillus terranigra TaxID=3058424 RepID=A0ABT8EDJ9_9BACL|nr:phosphotriesterase-related protein [Fictibacillus sp. CENA-BCM004]MDN4076014.1 phosphotriesterase-related protein [Fictibacillus sp. CENA-BCM004]
MSKEIVRTVLGDIPSTELGIVYAHEHLIIQGGLGVMKKSDLRLDSIDKSIEEVEECKQAGAQTFVDFMPLDCGRNPLALVEIANRTKTHIIAATGFHKPMYYDDLHWIYHYSIDQITDLLIKECEEGMDRYSYNGPLIERIQAKAGVLKGASDYNVTTPVSKKLFEAVALAHLETGVPIATHTEHGTCGMEQVELLSGFGVKPENVIICHMDRNPDLFVHKELARTGCYIEYDNATRIKYHSDSHTVQLIMKMIESGFGDKLLLGTDFALRSYWKAYGGGPGMAYLLKSFVPRLKEEGIPEDMLSRILRENPQKAYAIRTF